MTRIMDRLGVGVRALGRVSQGPFILLMVFALLAGCSSQSETAVENKKTVRYHGVTEAAQDEPKVSEKVITKTEQSTTSNEPSGGLLSGTVSVVGEALALPFRVMGGLIRAVF